MAQGRASGSIQPAREEHVRRRAVRVAGGPARTGVRQGEGCGQSRRHSAPRVARYPSPGLEHIGKHRILALAAGVTFYALLAIFPGIGATLALYGLFADPHSAQLMFDQLSSILPGGGQDILRDQVTRLTAQPSTRLGFAFLLGLAISLWSAGSGVRALIDTLNIVYGEDEKRDLVKLYLFSLAQPS